MGLKCLGVSVAGLSEHVLGMVLGAERQRSSVCQGGSISQWRSVAQGSCGKQSGFSNHTGHDCAEDHLQQTGVSGLRRGVSDVFAPLLLLRDVGPAESMKFVAFFPFT